VDMARRPLSVNTCLICSSMLVILAVFHFRLCRAYYLVIGR
jgi:hypothetical protein